MLNIKFKFTLKFLNKPMGLNYLTISSLSFKFQSNNTLYKPIIKCLTKTFTFYNTIV